MTLSPSMLEKNPCCNVLNRQDHEFDGKKSQPADVKIVEVKKIENFSGTSTVQVANFGHRGGINTQMKKKIVRCFCRADVGRSSNNLLTM